MPQIRFSAAVPDALNGCSLPEVQSLFSARGLSAHQARLTFQAIQRHGILDPGEMPEISAKCREFLRCLRPLPRLSLDSVHRSADGATKLRLKTRDAQMIEAVIIPAQNARRRVTLCVSCQVGCAAGCAFCRTGALGLKRNLEAWEIVEQYRIAGELLWRNPPDCDAIRRIAPLRNPACPEYAAPRRQSNPNESGANRKSKITNVVFMGMGEPLQTMESVLRACRIFNEDLGAGLSPRHIVVSTAGVGNRIRELWQEGVASLALSLHATTDELRRQLVPLARQWDLAALRQILLSIPWRRRETVTIAYLLLGGLNDTRDDARRLAEWLRGMPAKLNLLEFNSWPQGGGGQAIPAEAETCDKPCAFRRASPEKLAAFRQWLYDFGVFNTLRHSRGSDVLAACGLLAGQYEEVKSKK